MPIVAAECPSCGRIFETLIGSTVAGAGDKPVCECGQIAKQVPSARGAVMAKGYDWERLEKPTCKADLLERQAVMEHRKWLEEHHDERESGELTVVERGPNWARPFANAERPRKFY